MPNILVDLPKGALTAEQRRALVDGLNQAAAEAEQIPAQLQKRALCWVLINEVEAGHWTCGAVDMTSQILPCRAVVYVPAGVLDESARADYVRLVHQAFERAKPAEDKRQLMTSVIVQDVADGTWGANGAIWRLPQFAAAAGFAHLQGVAAAV
ncbi:tautomerase family protein [Pseudomonas sp. NFIX28]|uniref:tautomerase family protein n=1 Tax=Pseudomonas sp. NFIX28 TaxID=1566235 RepID=UPI00089C0C42|nr:tautomerase family protein [Pseudomonas sp. NFIX28]SDZ65433.1 Phenylpyruvate tautomerase PptA, 4-oxalocrotonate tautomerase family [Pseudomonas sp. NFIX28]